MTFLGLQTELDNRISSAKITGFWSESAKKEWINQAGMRVCDFKPWEALKHALYITTTGQREYYDYPANNNNAFKYNSIYNIIIEDEEYFGKDGRRRVKWDDYQKAKSREDEEKIFTNHNKYYFLNPVPEDGKTMSIWGLRRWQKLTEDTDEPILPQDFDEAIVRVALATCMRKAKRWDEARAELLEVLSPEGGVLMNIWNQEQDEGPRGYGGTIKHIRYE
jgi:hypothetical protein